MAADYPDWSKPRTLDALPNSLLYHEGEPATSVGNTEGNRNGVAVPAGYRRIITTWVASDADGSRPFSFIIVRGSDAILVHNDATAAINRGVSWSGYIVLQAGDYVRTRHFIGTAADRITWWVTGWDVPV